MLMFPDEEDELGDAGRRQLRIILGPRDDGTIITLRFQVALSEALGWVGLEEWPHDPKELVVKGQSTPLAKPEEAWKAAKARVILGTRPESRTAY